MVHIRQGNTPDEHLGTSETECNRNETPGAADNHQGVGDSQEAFDTKSESITSIVKHPSCAAKNRTSLHRA